MTTHRTIYDKYIVLTLLILALFIVTALAVLDGNSIALTLNNIATNIALFLWYTWSIIVETVESFFSQFFGG